MRNIPAYAGKTYASGVACQVAQEHPRVCGENVNMHKQAFVAKGTSPRMRGKPTITSGDDRFCRNIPAYAGKTPCCMPSSHAMAEHPRVCGENSMEHLIGICVGGTSPRMRGKPKSAAQSPLAAGNIPAYAGKTPYAKTAGNPKQEHPRVCGENALRKDRW